MGALNALFYEIKDIINSSKYSQVEKDEHIIIVATRALKVLEVADIFKDKIDDYDNIVKFLTKITSPKLGS